MSLYSHLLFDRLSIMSLIKSEMYEERGILFWGLKIIIERGLERSLERFNFLLSYFLKGLRAKGQSCLSVRLCHQSLCVCVPDHSSSQQAIRHPPSLRLVMTTKTQSVCEALLQAAANYMQMLSDRHIYTQTSATLNVLLERAWASVAKNTQKQHADKQWGDAVEGNPFPCQKFTARKRWTQKKMTKPKCNN